MRKIIVSLNTTLDGIMDPLDWSFQFFNDEIAQYGSEQLFAADALIMGRETYEGFADAWGSRDSGADAFTERMNSLPKYVASTTLKEPLKWNANLLKGDIPKEVEKLKQQPGMDILMYGAGTFTHLLMQHGLIDEIRFWVHPVVWGKGEYPFKNASGLPVLKLVGTKTFSSGVVILSYQPTKSDVVALSYESIKG